MAATSSAPLLTLTFSLSLTLTLVLWTMACLVREGEGRRVVSIPFPYTSHTKYHVKVASVLAKKGHDVWVTMPVYLLEKNYLDTSAFNIIPYDTAPGLEERTMEVMTRSYFEQDLTKFWDFLRICHGIFDALLRNESFTAAIDNVKPDLIVIDNLPMFYAMSVIPYKLGVPFAFLGSVYFPLVQRIPFSPAECPFVVLPYSNNMTFFQRVHTVLFYIVYSLFDPSLPMDAVATYAPDMPYIRLDDLSRKAEIFLVEHDYVLDYPKPTLPNVKLIGGTAPGPAKPLPKDLQVFMDTAGDDGVVIVSFGSYVLGLPEHISNKLLRVLRKLPMKSIFRSNLTSPDPAKIYMSSWFPQNDLLGHPNTKVFVSHCGKNGQYEALFHAVPVVAIPLFTDQAYNAERVRVKGMAEVLELNTVSAEEMERTILKVAREPRYKEAVLKRSRLFKELYGVPMDTAVYWLEHVMEHGGDYMRSAGQQMPWYQFVLLDVFLFVACALVLIVAVLWVFLKAFCRCCCRCWGLKKKMD